MSVGFNFSTGQSDPKLSFGLTPANPATTVTGLSFGASKTSTAFPLGAATTQSSGFSFGPTVTSSSAGIGLNLTTTKQAVPTTTSSTLFPTLTLGGLSTTSAAPTTSNSILNAFSNTGASKSKGLGGIDPQVSGGGSGSGSSGKLGDTKSPKESQVQQEILTTITDFKTFVKTQKSIRENITRMSSKPMFKVEEELAVLKQLLLTVGNAMQQQAAAVSKLKEECSQELKSVEIAQRTKEIPRGLQYENTAPNEYFQCLVGEFEGRMCLYRQHIEQMENNLNSISERTAMTPQELADVLNKLHHSFIGLAAQLHVIHENVKGLKEQFLSYRKVVTGDVTDIFEKKRKAADVKASNSKTGGTQAGPTPFSGISNTAALAMAAALNRAQQPLVAAQAVAPAQVNNPFGGSGNTLLGGQPSITGGLFNTTLNQTNTGFGTLGQNKPASTGLFGSSNLFGSNTTTSAGTGLFGSTNTANTSFFGTAAPAQPTGLLGLNTGGGSSVFGATNFQLQTPPLGKRNKRDA